MKLPNNYGTVFKLKDVNRRKPWCVRVAGKYIGYSETYEDALSILADYHKDPWIDKGNTYADVFKLWEENIGINLKKDTVDRYRRTFRCYCKSIEKKKFRDIKVTDYYKILNNLEVTNGTKNNIIKFFKAIDRTAYRFDIATRKETDKLTYFKKEVPKERKPFTEEEIKKLWNNQSQEDVDLVLILLYTGLRSGELAEIKLENINLDEDYIIGGFKTEMGTNRYIPIHSRIKPLIKQRIQRAKNDTLLNYSSKQLRVRFKKALTKLNINHVPHECRHTFITRLDNAGANRNCINLIVGHKGNNVGERIYTHKTKQQLHDTMALLV